LAATVLFISLARLVPLAPAARPKKLGLLKGRIRVPDDFNEPLPEAVLGEFEGR
jgi:antitoxin (DNA-binding transcriptional repressor) of toxin-antitoxin stability system